MIEKAILNRMEQVLFDSDESPRSYERSANIHLKRLYRPWFVDDVGCFRVVIVDKTFVLLLPAGR